MTHFCGSYEIPLYAIPYLVNNDPSGLTDDEIELVNAFTDSEFPNGFSIDFPAAEECYFSSSPAIGAPATVCRANIYSY